MFVVLVVEPFRDGPSSLRSLREPAAGNYKCTTARDVRRSHPQCRRRRMGSIFRELSLPQRAVWALFGQINCQTRGFGATSRTRVVT